MSDIPTSVDPNRKLENNGGIASDDVPSPVRDWVNVNGRQLEIAWHTPSTVTRPGTIVMLHEGIGSVSTWRDYPHAVAATIGCRVLAYSRHGYGQSEVLVEPRAPDFMHREAQDVLPALLRVLGIQSPILYGHSDGASIALLFAAAYGASATAGLILEAPHVLVEAPAPDGARRARLAFDGGTLALALARHHRDARRTFFGWHDIWTAAEFNGWNIEPALESIDVPLLAIQGHDDEYGTMIHLDSIAARVRGPCQLLKLAQCGHAPHRDQRELVLRAALSFVDDPSHAGRFGALGPSASLGSVAARGSRGPLGASR